MVVQLVLFSQDAFHTLPHLPHKTTGLKYLNRKGVEFLLILSTRIVNSINIKNSSSINICKPVRHPIFLSGNPPLHFIQIWLCILSLITVLDSLFFLLSTHGSDDRYSFLTFSVCTFIFRWAGWAGIVKFVITAAFLTRWRIWWFVRRRRRRWRRRRWWRWR